ncbi:hypothetical protein RISK_000679 [Rhodopirellula islandica]|uniref:Uncharacterized protein n=1 Tax=Rhodopirellula islandica TaxID=595434 RepID=A0A0J1BM43_RHOIS|nr:hypothetical protein RISK_000679 [Rhodopirellula islandica]
MRLKRFEKPFSGVAASSGIWPGLGLASVGVVSRSASSRCSNA